MTPSPVRGSKAEWVAQGPAPSDTQCAAVIPRSWFWLATAEPEHAYPVPPIVKNTRPVVLATAPPPAQGSPDAPETPGTRAAAAIRALVQWRAAGTTARSVTAKDGRGVSAAPPSRPAPAPAQAAGPAAPRST